MVSLKAEIPGKRYQKSTATHEDIVKDLFDGLFDHGWLPLRWGSGVPGADLLAVTRTKLIPRQVMIFEVKTEDDSARGMRPAGQIGRSTPPSAPRLFSIKVLQISA